jgi:hypothetical protein
VEVANMRVKYRSTPLYEENGIPFEVAYCLTRIGKQPDDYDGPTRYCKKRAAKDDNWDGERYAEGAFCPSCRFHGGRNHRDGTEQHLEDPRTVTLTHGLYAEDESLRMDFTDAEQALYDSIVEEWPDIYNWVSEDEDPARYLMLRKVASNTVRTLRAEDYIDSEGEVRITDVFNEEGMVIDPDGDHQENPLAREYRLLWSEITDQLAELGLTPKARQQMDTMEASESKNEALADIANEALEGDHEYDPSGFGEGNDGAG